MAESAPRYIPVGAGRKLRVRAPNTTPAGFVRQPVARRARQVREKLSWPGVLFLGALGLLLSPDLLISPPGAGLLRLGAPAVLCLLLLRQIFRTGRLPHSPLGPWLGALIAAGVLSSAFSDVPVLGYLKLALYLSIALPLCLTASIHSTFFSINKTLRLTAYLVFLVLFANLVLLRVNGTGMFDNPNKAGMLSVCVWPLLAVLLKSKNRGEVLLASVGIVVAVAIGVVGWSRGAIVGVTSGLVTLYALRQSATLRSVVLTFGVFAVVVILAFMGTRQTFEQYAFKNRESFIDGTRQFMLQETINQWSSRPLLGYGFGLSWTLQADDVDDVLATGRMSWFTVEFGNSTLAILSGGGIALLLVFVGMFTKVATRAFKAARLKGTDPNSRYMLIVYMSGVAGMLVHSQAEAWLMAPMNWSTAIFYLYLALVSVISERLIAQARAASLAKR